LHYFPSANDEQLQVIALIAVAIIPKLGLQNENRAGGAKLFFFAPVCFTKPRELPTQRRCA
jgi:hypothetical protein